MSIGSKAKNQIFNICETILNIIIVAIAADVNCVACYHPSSGQFTDATIFGYFLINLLIFISIFIEEQNFHKIWRAIVTILGALMFFITAILIFEYIGERNNSSYGYYYYDYGYGSRRFLAELIVIAIFCLVMVALFIIDTILIFKKNALQNA